MSGRGRPPKGRGGKSIHAAIRLTEQEAAELTSRYGTPGKGLRAALNRLLGEDHPSVRAEALRAKITEPVSKEQIRQPLAVTETPRSPVKTPTPSDAAPQGSKTAEREALDKMEALAAEPAHLHRRGDVIRRDYVKGIQVKVYACSTCGKEMS